MAGIDAVGGLFLSARYSDATILSSDGHSIPIHKNIVFEQAPILASKFVEDSHVSPFNFTIMAAVIRYFYDGTIRTDIFPRDPLPARELEEGEVNSSLPSTKQDDNQGEKAKAGSDDGRYHHSTLVVDLGRLAIVACAANYYGMMTLRKKATDAFEDFLRRNWDANVLFEVLEMDWIMPHGGMVAMSEIPAIAEAGALVASGHPGDILRSKSFVNKYFSPFGKHFARIFATIADRVDPLAPSAQNGSGNDAIGGELLLLPDLGIGPDQLGSPDSPSAAIDEAIRLDEAVKQENEPIYGLRSLGPVGDPMRPLQGGPISKKAAKKELKEVKATANRLREVHRLQAALEKKNKQLRELNRFADSVKLATDRFNNTGKFCKTCPPWGVSIQVIGDGRVLVCDNCKAHLGR